MQQQGRALHGFGHCTSGKRCAGDDVDVVSWFEAASCFLSDKLPSEAFRSNPIAVRLAIRDHLHPRHSALAIEEGGEVDVLVLTNFTIEERVAVDLITRVRDVENVLSSFELLAELPPENAPTFHEIRSLSKRLYAAQGNVDTKALLGHKDEKTAALYADPRGSEAIRVTVKPLGPSERHVITK